MNGNRDNMHIAFVITRGDAVGGATVHVRDMARYLVDRGHRATVLIGACPGGSKDEAIDELRRYEISCVPIISWVLALLLVPLARTLVRIWFGKRSWWGYPVAIFENGDPAYSSFPGVAIRSDFQSAPLYAKGLGLSRAIIAVPGIVGPQLVRLLGSHANVFRRVYVVPGLDEFSSLGIETRDICDSVTFELRRSLLDPQWYTQTKQLGWVHRIGHLADIFCATTPSAVLPVWHEEGIWEIPGSMLFTPSHGLRRLVPSKARVHRARKGLRRAVGSEKIFHLWFHPTDVVIRMDAMLDALRQILEYACQLRESRRLSILTMTEITELMSRNFNSVQVLEEAFSR